MTEKRDLRAATISEIIVGLNMAGVRGVEGKAGKFRTVTGSKS